MGAGARSNDDDDPGDPGDPPLDSPDESPSVRDIAARLRAAFPLVDAVVVDATVRTAYEAFRQARVRAYIPILVERRSRQALATLQVPPGREPDERVVEAAGAPVPVGGE
ncbi:three-helix bundle dimerization domain-containing protein [Streptomyces sp. NPDC047981]|uniref:three-helix bundle dimerization domain-containing protein n=1 Tax=Streptomyces sp. NPDC047981 TaxID=3154610 RepID=UPI00344116CC